MIRTDEREEPTIIVLGGVNSSDITYKGSQTYDATCGLTSGLTEMFGKGL
jgi:hypothetical protein